ncbi:NAD(P)H-dependent oxidoreductase [Pseudaeromonas paramecii]|uniref:NAD(P)H-dependent oxidoreductase n=1 Tax=Pseudaeromonas paramecii TaxID=2138166 RepID=A0ABP8QF28_9GAMM
MTRKIVVILGHPARQSLCGELADRYQRSAEALGHTVRRLDLGQLDFDPVLHEGYRQVQPLEPDLQRAQADLLWADHLVWIYPNWWGGPPALLKGFIDRLLLPGFAFKYHAQDPLWDRLLTGRSGQLIVTMDSPPWYYRWFTRQPGHQLMKRAVLGFCGIKPVKVLSLGPVKSATETRRQGWLAQVERLPHSL